MSRDAERRGRRLGYGMALLVLVIGCARDRDSADERRGGIAVVGGYVELRSMNPIAALTDLNKAIVRYVLFTPLLLLDAELNVRPWLAAAWDTTAGPADSLDVTFHLRRDVRWHDGVVTSAHDVAFAYRLARDARATWPDAAALALHASAPEVRDSFTVRFRMRRHADYLEAFALLPPLPRHILGDVPPEAMARHAFGTAPVGNGPFRFVRGTSQEWVFAANLDFPAALGGPPLLDRVVFRTIPEQTSLVAELLTGRVDLAVSIRPPQVPQLRSARDVGIVTFPVPNWIFIALNTRLRMFDTRDERRALALAIDRQALVAGLMGGVNTTGRSAVTPVHWAFDETAAVPHAPDSARLLLARAGWVDRDNDGVRENNAGEPFRFRLKVWHGSGSYRELAEAVQAQLARVGVAALVEVVEFNTFVGQVQGQPQPDGSRRRDFDAAIGNWTDNLIRKDDSQLLHSRHRDSARQWTGYNSARVDALLDSLSVTVERTESLRLWRAYQHALIDESPLIFLFYAQGINGVRSSLHGVADGDPRGPLASIRSWSLRVAPDDDG